MSYEVANQEIALGQKNTYPEIPGAKRGGTSGFNTNVEICGVLLYQGKVSEGQVRLRNDGLLKAARGITTIEEALRTCET